MSWLDTVDKDLIIKTGDGKTYKPLWKPSTKSVEYNIAEFEFPGVEGTLVSRGTSKGTKYAVEMYFQGDSHLDDSAAFEKSARDNRMWTISHPLYGSIYVHPSGLNFDNTRYNISVITGTLLETITDQYPKITVDPVDKINADKITLDATFAQSYATVVTTPEIADMNSLQRNNTTLFNEAKKAIKTTTDFQNITNLYQKANSDILKIILPIQNAVVVPIQSLQAVITYPAKLADTVTNRIALLKRQFVLLGSTLSTITRKNDKHTYENNQGVLVSSMAETSVTNYDYKNSDEVLAVTADIVATYNQYIADIDSLQTPTGGDEDSYIPDQASIDGLRALINFTVSNLLAIAVDSKQARYLICEEDTNLILLAHRLYGLLPDDSTIQTIAADNNIGLNEYLIIPKGRKIVYYV